jgi:hypothetical protein
MEKMDGRVHCKYLTGLDIMGMELFTIDLLSVAKRYSLQKINESIIWADKLNAKHLTTPRRSRFHAARHRPAVRAARQPAPHREHAEDGDWW